MTTYADTVQLTYKIYFNELHSMLAVYQNWSF